MVDTNTIAKGLGVTGFSPLTDFLRLHIANALDDRVGNDPNLRNGANIEKIELGPERHGYDSGIDNILYDKVNPAQNYYQDGINDDVAKERASRVPQQNIEDGSEDLNKSLELKQEADAEKLRAHQSLLKLMNASAFRSMGGI